MPGSPLEKPVPGRLFVWVKRLSWVELAIFTALIVFWLVPGSKPRRWCSAGRTGSASSPSAS